MLGYVFFGLILSVTIPIVFSMLSNEKNDKTNIVKNPIGIKCLMVGFICFLITMAILAGIFQDYNEDPYGIVGVISVISVFSVLANMIVSYKLEVFDDYFLFRNFWWRTKKYTYDQITGLKRRKGNEFIICYVVLIGKTKIEISNTMVNFKLIDNKLRREDVFRKFKEKRWEKHIKKNKR